MRLIEIQNNHFLTTYEETKKWLINMNIKKHIINPKTLEVDVEATVDISMAGFELIPVKFNYVYGHFKCHNNFLTTLEGAPNRIDGEFQCYNNKLTSLQGCPPITPKEFSFDANPSTLNNIDKYVKSAEKLGLLNFRDNVCGLMRLFLIKNLQNIHIYGAAQAELDAAYIINKHLKTDKSGPACQIELIDAGLGDFAKL